MPPGIRTHSIWTPAFGEHCLNASSLVPLADGRENGSQGRDMSTPHLCQHRLKASLPLTGLMEGSSVALQPPPRPPTLAFLDPPPIELKVTGRGFRWAGCECQLCHSLAATPSATLVISKPFLKMNLDELLRVLKRRGTNSTMKDANVIRQRHRCLRWHQANGSPSLHDIR